MPAVLSRMVCVQGLPVAPLEKHHKILNILTVVFRRFQSVQGENIYIPIDPKTNKTIGIALFLCVSEKIAGKVAFGLNEWPMDSKHTTMVRSLYFPPSLFLSSCQFMYY